MSLAPTPRRVLQICLSDSWGGLEMYPGRVVPELQRQGWAVYGLALQGSKVAAAFESAGVETLTFTSRTRALFGVASLLRFLKQHDIRVVHCHKSSDMRIGALLSSLWPSLRLCFTDHMGVKKPKKDAYHRWAYGKAQRVFSISQATYASNQQALPVAPERLRQLYYGIDLNPYQAPMTASQRTARRQSLGVPNDAVVVGLPGRISRDKGHEVWLAALACAIKKAPKLKLFGVIMGEASGIDALEGGFAEQLQRQVDELGIREHVKFAGFRSDLAECLMAIDIACVPSVNEAFGLSVIEAMAAFCPVIGSDSGAIPELIDQTRGRLAAPSSPLDWATTIIELAADETLRTDLGHTAHHWVMQRFDLALHVERLIEEYSAT